MQRIGSPGEPVTQDTNQWPGRNWGEPLADLQARIECSSEGDYKRHAAELGSAKQRVDLGRRGFLARVEAQGRLRAARGLRHAITRSLRTQGGLYRGSRHAPHSGPMSPDKRPSFSGPNSTWYQACPSRSYREATLPTVPRPARRYDQSGRGIPSSGSRPGLTVYDSNLATQPGTHWSESLKLTRFPTAY